MAKPEPTFQDVADTLDGVVVSLETVLNDQKDMKYAISQLTRGQSEMKQAIVDFSDGQIELGQSVSELKDIQSHTQTQLSDVSNGLSELKDYTVSGFEVMNDRFDILEAQVDNLQSGMPYQH